MPHGVDRPPSDKAALIMCRPTFFEIARPDPIHGHANEFSAKAYEEFLQDPQGFREVAIEQWTNLRDLFRKLGATVHEIAPIEGLPDMCFTADTHISMLTADADECGLSQRVSLMSYFSNEERQGEVNASRAFLDACQNVKPKIITSQFRFEGNGDNLYDPFRDVWWSGFAQEAGRQNAANGRSDIMAHAMLEQITGAPVISLPMTSPCYHDDTAIAALNKGHIYCCPDEVMHPGAIEKIKREGIERFGLDPDKYLRKLSKQDAFALGANMRHVDFDTIVLPLCSEELQESLASDGYNVYTTDVRKFIMAGGGAHCLSNNINKRRVAGGTASQFGYQRLEINLA